MASLSKLTTKARVTSDREADSDVKRSPAMRTSRTPIKLARRYVAPSVWIPRAQRPSFGYTSKETPRRKRTIEKVLIAPRCIRVSGAASAAGEDAETGRSGLDSPGISRSDMRCDDEIEVVEY